MSILLFFLFSVSTTPTPLICATNEVVFDKRGPVRPENHHDPERQYDFWLPSWALRYGLEQACMDLSIACWIGNKWGFQNGIIFGGTWMIVDFLNYQQILKMTKQALIKSYVGKALPGHYENVLAAIQSGYKDDAQHIQVEQFAPNKKYAAVSMSTSTYDYTNAIRVADTGGMIFHAAGNDDEPIGNLLLSRDQGNQNFLTPYTLKFHQRFNIRPKHMDAFDRHRNVIHCGVSAPDGLSLADYSNYPSKEQGHLKFLCIDLDGPSGTSFAAPKLMGIYLRVLSEYPNTSPDDIRDLMFKTANYIAHKSISSSLMLIKFYLDPHTIDVDKIHESLDFLRFCLNHKIDYQSPYNEQILCTHYQLAEEITTSFPKGKEIKLEEFKMQLGSIMNANKKDTYFNNIGPVHIVNQKRLLEEANRLWGSENPTI